MGGLKIWQSLGVYVGFGEKRGEPCKWHSRDWQNRAFFFLKSSLSVATFLPPHPRAPRRARKARATADAACFAGLSACARFARAREEIVQNCANECLCTPKAGAGGRGRWRKKRRSSIGVGLGGFQALGGSRSWGLQVLGHQVLGWVRYWGTQILC